MLPSERTAKNAVNSAQNALKCSKQSLYKDAKIEAGITADKEKDAVNDRDEEIEKLKAEIEKLEEAAKITEIKAPADRFMYITSP